MGRQLQVPMDSIDERRFVAFLRATASVQLIESFAPTIDELWVEEVNSTFVGRHTYDIWNKAFEWTPKYGTVGPQASDADHLGWRYVGNKGAAPVLSFSRSNPLSGEPGRLYWAKHFSAADGITYNHIAFGQWVDRVWRWIRAEGKKAAELPLNPYVLPNAAATLLPSRRIKGCASIRQR